MSTIGKMLQQKVEHTLQRLDINSSHKLLIAFSGGPDSTALLHILHELSKKPGQFCSLQITAVYINHNMRSREELRKEELHIEKFCTALDIEYYLIRIPRNRITQLAEIRGKGPEEAARYVRYIELEEAVRKYSCDFLLTAHTFDDQLETLIMRFFKGSGVSGLIGIQEKSHGVIRPLLDITKNELLDYVTANELEYSIDSTNEKQLYLRNSMRSNMIPVIEELFPGYRKSLHHLSKKMAMTQEFLDTCMGDVSSKIHSCEEGGVSFSYSHYIQQTTYARFEFLYAAWAGCMEGVAKYEQLPFKTMCEIDDYIMTASSRETGYAANFYGKTLLFIKSDTVFWKRAVVHTRKNRYLKKVYKKDIQLFADWNLKTVDSQVSKQELDIYIDISGITGPLVVRSAMAGDTIYLLEGKKSLKELYSDWKVPVEDRWMIPVLEDTRGIIAVLGKEFGFRNRIAVDRKIVDLDQKYGRTYRIFRIYRD